MGAHCWVPDITNPFVCQRLHGFRKGAPIHQPSDAMEQSQRSCRRSVSSRLCAGALGLCKCLVPQR